MDLIDANKVLIFVMYEDSRATQTDVALKAELMFTAFLISFDVLHKGFSVPTDDDDNTRKTMTSLQCLRCSRSLRIT